MRHKIVTDYIKKCDNELKQFYKEYPDFDGYPNYLKFKTPDESDIGEILIRFGVIPRLIREAADETDYREIIKDWDGIVDEKDSLRLEWLLDNLKYIDKDSYKPFRKHGYYEFFQKTDIQDLRKLIDTNMFVESIGRLVLSSSDLCESDLIEIKSGIDRLRKMCNNKSLKHENHKFFSRQLKSEKYIKPRGNI